MVAVSGFHLLIFGLLGKYYAHLVDPVFRDPRVERWASFFSVERGLTTGVSLMALAATLGAPVVGHWLQFGTVPIPGQWIFAAPDAQFGQPEMKLGVFAPAASVLLPYRLNLPMAEDLLYSGRSIGTTTALACGLVHAVADDPEAAALGWFRDHLEGKSAAALACATAAARGAMRRDVRQRLAEVERLYLDELMATRDAGEGLAAFLGKRRPNWEHR